MSGRYTHTSQSSRPTCRTSGCHTKLNGEDKNRGFCRACQCKFTPSPTPGPPASVYGGSQHSHNSPPPSTYGGSTQATMITASTARAQYTPTESTMRQSQHRTPFYQALPPLIASGPTRYVCGMGTPPPDPEHERLMADPRYTLSHTGHAGESYGSYPSMLPANDMSGFDGILVPGGSSGSAHGFAMYRDSSPVGGYIRERSHVSPSVASGGSHGRHDGRLSIPPSSNGQYDIRPAGPPSYNGRTRSGQIYRYGAGGPYPPQSR